MYHIYTGYDVLFFIYVLQKPKFQETISCTCTSNWIFVCIAKCTLTPNNNNKNEKLIDVNSLTLNDFNRVFWKCYKLKTLNSQNFTQMIRFFFVFSLLFCILKMFGKNRHQIFFIADKFQSKWSKI